MPFYISGTEVEASIDLGPAYRLWRVYRYGKVDTGYYRLPGPLTQHARHLSWAALSRMLTPDGHGYGRRDRLGILMLPEAKDGPSSVLQP
ncbi:hypothetical protein [Nocardioides sp. zg-1228]|uniref:hypothetical protein n=1 Tax=Nocardioides sp. zg-1228 TaxID=2763008 RepID=UPI001F12227C|nr:hypothetical protein [Nocardioides sp. zg-1228]